LDHVAREDAHLHAELVLDEVGEGEVLADQDPEQGREHRDHLQLRGPAASGGPQHDEGGEEADRPGDDPDLVAGPLDDEAPDDPADDRGDDACERGEADVPGGLGPDRLRLLPAPA
jgi:hypothetical protein